MISKEKKDIIFLRLFTDEDVNKQIKNACENHKVKTAIIISGIGQLKNAQLGYYKERGNYTNEIFNKPLEILSFNGNICSENREYSIHMHAVLSDEKKNAIGGHFIEGTVGITTEIVLLKTDIIANRKIDDDTGLKMLYFK